LSLLLLVPGLIALAGWFYWAHVTHRFRTISDGKVYQAGLMPPEHLVEVVREHEIRTVVDLRREKDDGSVSDEAEALRAIGVDHVHLPSGQVPKPETVDAFLALMADPRRHPVLIHCFDGTGRSTLFSALYRIEFEGWSNEDALQATRWVPAFSSFSRDSRKGRFLEEYQKRRR
jgi:protein tyrosine phosphatase (PTP) superfamily phosphohydrolase (DUF442 family)